MNEDTNVVIRTYLTTSSTKTDPLIALVADRIIYPRLPENTTLPAIGFFTRGGTSSPYIPPLPEPSVQFDCWADSPLDAREVYRALYEALQGIQRQVVSVGGTDYIIWGAEEEVQGQDLVDVEIPNYFRVLTFCKFMIKAE